MADPPAHTAQLHAWLDRMRAGDLAARDELLRCLWGRLERLARRMLRRYPGVRHWAQTGDVLQNALLRLLRALEQVRPESLAEFFGLAAEQMRRELLDLARHFHGPLGPATHLASQHPGHEPSAAPHGCPDAAADPDDLEMWCAFHDGVTRLPVVEREVVGLIFYHGWSQAEVAGLFGVTVRTVQRRWESALRKLRQAVWDNGPAA
jgi:RNA polymerase sigma-70 factor (ECF subfamily)